MDIAALFTSLLVSSIGFVAFSYGKRQKRLPQLVVGLTMFVYPYLIDSAWVMLLIAACLLGLLWLVVRLGF